ncbi:hypothetical protein [Oryzihumus sp.]
MSEGPALVPGELRGYRQFTLRRDGLYPLVHVSEGPWDGALQHARCAEHGHHPPGPRCRCGLYAWYLPGSATVSVGPVAAVVAARGRCVLGDRGFRAESARIEAVTLPASLLWRPRYAARVRAMLARDYPRTRVYRLTRRMLRDHPPHDVRGLGIDPPRDPSRAYRAAAVALWASFLLAVFSLGAVPHAARVEAVTHWWPLLILVILAWQTALIWLFMRLIAQQMPEAPREGDAPG